jgi:hypothetical protein
MQGKRGMTDLGQQLTHFLQRQGGALGVLLAKIQKRKLKRLAPLQACGVSRIVSSVLTCLPLMFRVRHVSVSGLFVLTHTKRISEERNQYL